MELPNCKGRKQLVNKFYFGGLYQGSDGGEKLWKKVADFIDNSYYSDDIRHIYISGDGGGWIKTGAKIINKAL
jgi:hypothetical protein